MEYSIRPLRPGETQEVRQLAIGYFSMVERLFIEKPKLGIVAQTEDGTIAGGALKAKGFHPRHCAVWPRALV